MRTIFKKKEKTRPLLDIVNDFDFLKGLYFEVRLTVENDELRKKIARMGVLNTNETDSEEESDGYSSLSESDPATPRDDGDGSF
jgi:hypothetical protein